MQDDPVVEKRRCRVSGKEFSITQRDVEFYKKISPKFGEYVAEIPYPTLCPEERARRRLLFRNERKWYRRECDATQKQMISVYSPAGGAGTPYIVYDQKVWWSDQRDPLAYGFSFNFSTSFTEQFGRLMKSVPMVNMINKYSENSEYTNISAYNKDCYLLVESSNNQDCLYGYWMQKSENCVDCSMINHSRVCYKSTDLDECYRVFRGQYCRGCSDSYLVENCDGCTFCIGCIGISNGTYMLFNQQATKEHYLKVRSLLLEGTSQQKQSVYERFEKLKSGYGPYEHIRNSEDVSGDYISDAKHVVDSYEVHDAEDVKYSKNVWFNSRDCMDVDTVGYSSFMVYEAINTALECSFDICTMRCRNCVSCLYCFNCDNSSHLFGCVGLRNQEYCIFNKQYTKQEYEKLVPKIIEHMKTMGERGEFFDPSLSPFGYNETVAQDYYPLSQSEAVTSGYEWSDYEAPAPKSNKIKKGSELPERIHEVDDEILQYAIKCEVTDKLFRIQPKELQFYRKHSVPLPRKHPDQRHLERLEMRS